MTTRCAMLALTANRLLPWAAFCEAPHVPCTVTRTLVAHVGSVKTLAARCTSGGQVAVNISVCLRVARNNRADFAR